MSRYGMLSQMVEASRTKQSFYHLDVGQYKTFVLVLHDPDDNKLKEKIERDFRVLDYQTGPAMLFLTWIKPPERWRGHRDHDYSFNPEGINFGFESDSLDLNLELLEVRRLFGIAENSSALVVFTELMSSDYLILNTSADSLSTQLLEIGRFSFEREMADGASDLLALRDYLDAKMCEKNEALVEILLKVMSLGSKETMLTGDTILRHQRVRDALRGASQKLRSVVHSEQDYVDSLLSFSNMLALNGQKHLHDGLINGLPISLERIITNKLSFLPINSLEESTSIYINTFNRLCDIFTFDNNLDYSALILYLSKILECECNASLYQFCRKIHHIRMPDYYRRYCDLRPNSLKVEFAIQNRFFSCSLNRYVFSSNERTLESKTLGELQTLVRWLQTFRDAWPFEDETINLSDQSEWQRLVNLRNNAAHVGHLLTLDDFSGAYNVFKRIFNQSLNTLLMMKRSCSGVPFMD